jgi:Zn ribbon nucleic-acid-binding protein
MEDVMFTNNPAFLSCPKCGQNIFRDTVYHLNNDDDKHAECTYCSFAIAQDLIVQRARKNIQTLVQRNQK